VESFVHLHTHTEFSMLDGAARIGELISLAKQDNQPAIAITDHGNMYGVIDFYKACKENDIKPIIGMEAYMTAESRLTRPNRRNFIYDDTGGEDESGKKLWYHLTLLAYNNQGYKNLMKLASEAFLSGYYYKPRLDFELLENYHEGLIATSGCLGGLVLQSLLKDKFQEALDYAVRFKDIFGKENFFIEIQDHGMPEQKKTNPALIELAKKAGLEIIATNDSHYCKKSDAEIHDALLCIQTGRTVSDSNRLKFFGSEHYLKTAYEMRQLFKDYPEACDNTLEIAQRVDLEIELNKSILPRFEVPKEFQKENYEQSLQNYLRFLTFNGAKHKYGDPLPQNVLERLDYELSVINDMGFAAYFLVVWDFVSYAKKNGIRVGPGRGSAAGCLVAYCLDIVSVDPIKYDLLFERFLNPGRKQMPDIDIDFDERKRGEVINYVARRYGKDRVAQIITFSMIRARAAVRDAARILGFPYSLGDKLAKAIPPIVRGRETPLWACFKEDEQYWEGYKLAAQLRQFYDEDPDARKVIETALGLEGLRRQDGIHAAAVVISDEALTEYVPVQRKPEPGQNPEQAPIVTQYDMDAVEAIGLLKMDFLGLRNLSVIDEAIELIKKTRGIDLNIDQIPLDDENTFEMLRKGDTLGVFQLESGPLRTLIKSLAPTSFHDIAALVALYRPGPMDSNMHIAYAERKNKREKVTYLHPDLEDILKDTYGLMIYQESVMRVAQKFAGYSLAEADDLRKACGKKIRSLIQAHREKFVKGALERGYDKHLANKLFDMIEPFADYAFNKSHSYGYGLVSYQTAYLRANYYPEYMAALLSSVKDDQEHMAQYLADLKQHGVKVRLPDINDSQSRFNSRQLEDGSYEVIVGISAIRNVGENVAEKIVTQRNENGPFKDFYDFCMRMDLSVLNKRTIEALIKAGAFDNLGHTRRGLFESYEEIIAQSLENRKLMEKGQVSLFHADNNINPLWPEIKNEEFDQQKLLAFEKEMLGIYISKHPLSDCMDALLSHVDLPISELIDEFNKFQNGEQYSAIVESKEITLGGIITNYSARTTKKGDKMASFKLEELSSSIEVLIFPKLMANLGLEVNNDMTVFVTGRLDLRELEPKIIASDIKPVQIETLVHKGKEPLRLTLSEKATDEQIKKLKEVILAFPGQREVVIHVGSKTFKLPSRYCVDDSTRAIAEFKYILGPNAVKCP
jgi:DNA polymerase-3 subunit alpha